MRDGVQVFAAGRRRGSGAMETCGQIRVAGRAEEKWKARGRVLHLAERVTTNMCCGV